MNYWTKNPESPIINSGLSYEAASQRLQLKSLLLEEQKGFCAYSERHIIETDAHEIEHFDPNLKHTPKDNYHNWYAVGRWFNMYKPKKLDERFLPILLPHDETTKQRIIYEVGIFKTVETDDIKAKNLIDFLGLNKIELCNDRNNHIEALKNLRQLCGDDELFIQQFKLFRQNLSFITAIEHEFDISLQHIINQF